MNAAQRRTATRATARALPHGSTVLTSRGTAAIVIGHRPGAVVLKFKNNRTTTERVGTLA